MLSPEFLSPEFPEFHAVIRSVGVDDSLYCANSEPLAPIYDSVNITLNSEDEL